MAVTAGPGVSVWLTSTLAARFLSYFVPQFHESVLVGRHVLKRLVDIDDDLLERARSVAGTGTIKDTVHAALERLIDDERVRRHVERLRGSGALDLARIEEARRPRAAR
jgi:Arc/MetJ family transcription regulator